MKNFWRSAVKASSTWASTSRTWTARRARCRRSAIELIQSGRGYGVRGDGAFAYFATADRLSTLIELIQLPQERYPPDATYPL